MQMPLNKHYTPGKLEGNINLRLQLTLTRFCIGTELKKACIFTYWSV